MEQNFNSASILLIRKWSFTTLIQNDSHMLNKSAALLQIFGQFQLFIFIKRQVSSTTIEKHSKYYFMKLLLKNAIGRYKVLTKNSMK